MTDAPTEPASATTSFGFREVERAAKAPLVRGVFDRVARRYDLMNDLMSAGVHRVWKDMTISRANPQPGELLVDVAGGTGDLAMRWVDRGAKAAARRGGRPTRAVVVDVNAEMVGAGRDRLGEGASPRSAAVSWSVGDAERLPLPDGCADAVTIAFGIRNVTDRAGALASMRRVLKPGGRFLCLEFSRPTAAPLRAVYDAWSFHAIPRIGEAVAKDEASYRYLVESIRRFPIQEAFADEVRAAGFSRVGYTNFSGGVAALHTGWAV